MAAQSAPRMAIGRRACTGGIHCDGIRGGTAGGALYVELQVTYSDRLYEYSTQLQATLTPSPSSVGHHWGPKKNLADRFSLPEAKTPLEKASGESLPMGTRIELPLGVARVQDWPSTFGRAR